MVERIREIWEAFRSGYKEGRTNYAAMFDEMPGRIPAECKACRHTYRAMPFNKHGECWHCEQRILHNARQFGLNDAALDRLTSRLQGLDKS